MPITVTAADVGKYPHSSPAGAIPLDVIQPESLSRILIPTGVANRVALQGDVAILTSNVDCIVNLAGGAVQEGTNTPHQVLVWAGERVSVYLTPAMKFVTVSPVDPADAGLLFIQYVKPWTGLAAVAGI